MQDHPMYLIDGISSIAIHNGVARIQFMCLGLDGEPMPKVQLHVPVNSIKMVIKALRKATIK